MSHEEFSIEVQMSDALEAQELFQDLKRTLQITDEITQEGSNGYSLREDLQEDPDAIDEIWNEFLTAFDERGISIY